MTTKAEFVHLNGNLMPVNKALVYPGTSAVYYGTGCFETLRADQAKMVLFDEHIQRLNYGLEYLGVPEHLRPGKTILKKEVLALIDKNELSRTSARVRIQVSLDERNGYQQPPGEGAVLRFITAKKLKPAADSISLATVQTKVIPAVCKPALFKSSNMLHFRSASREGRKLGADDGLMFNIHNFVAETSVANIFWKRGDKIFTPSAECDILPGITRGILLKILSEKEGVTIQQGTFSRKEVESSELVWVTNSVREILPVRRLDNHTFPTDVPFYKELRKDYRNFTSEYFN